MNRLIPLALVLVPAAAMAQEPNEPLPAAVARVIQAARDSGAFERRVLGTRYLHCTEPGREALLELSCRYYGDPKAAEPAGLEVKTVVRALQPGGAVVTFLCRTDMRGGFVSSRLVGLTPKKVGRPERTPGVVVEVQRAGDQVTRTVTRPEQEPERDTLPWSADALPGAFVSAVLAPLFDQGLATPLDFRVFTGLRLDETLSTLSTNGVDERGFQILRVVTRMGPTGLVRYDLAYRLEGEQKGELVGGRLDVLHRDAPLFVAITEAEAKALSTE